MSFTWTSHRFAGGALALDVANSVILRADPDARQDRFAVPAQLAAFPEAASRMSAERLIFGRLEPLDDHDIAPLLALREAIDAYFRMVATAGKADDIRLARLLEAVAASLRRGHDRPARLDAATAHSALRLLAVEDGRMKACAHCGWLFVDRSRNRSRAWCDMAVCGNRVKARRHYRRKCTEATP